MNNRSATTVIRVTAAIIRIAVTTIRMVRTIRIVIAIIAVRIVERIVVAPAPRIIETTVIRVSVAEIDAVVPARTVTLAKTESESRAHAPHQLLTVKIVVIPVAAVILLLVVNERIVIGFVRNICIYRQFGGFYNIDVIVYEILAGHTAGEYRASDQSCCYEIFEVHD